MGRNENVEITCGCGGVALEAAGPPIMTVVCHCESCRKEAARFASLPGAPQVLGPDGGTEFVVARKDRVKIVRGQDRLRAYRRTPEATTRRVLASCCDDPMFLEFSKGHWLSLYRDRFGDHAPALEMRVMTKDHPEAAPFTDALPSYGTHSVAFMWRLLRAWAAMGFRVPPLDPISDA